MKTISFYFFLYNHRSIYIPELTKGEGKRLSSPQVQPPPPPTNQPQEERKGTHTNKHYKERERKGIFCTYTKGGGYHQKREKKREVDKGKKK